MHRKYLARRAWHIVSAQSILPIIITTLVLGQPFRRALRLREVECPSQGHTAWRPESESSRVTDETDKCPTKSNAVCGV